MDDDKTEARTLSLELTLRRDLPRPTYLKLRRIVVEGNEFVIRLQPHDGGRELFRAPLKTPFAAITARVCLECP